MGNHWIKWPRGFQQSPQVYFVAQQLSIDERITACCCMEFLSWFDVAAKSYKVSLGTLTIELLESRLQLPSGLIQAMINAKFFAMRDNVLVAVDKTLFGTGQKYRKEQRVYFMRSQQSNLIKIGISHNPEFRCKSLKTTEPIEIIGHYEGDMFEEKKLHRQFAKDRKFGEWFEPSPELVGLIRSKGFAI